MSLKNKTVLITGASRGIGREIALACASQGAQVVLAAKSVTEGKLPGTIFSVADEVEKLGGKALAVPLDVRFPEQIEAMVTQTIDKFGRIDALINNAGAISLTPLEMTPPKKIDLMYHVNVRAALLCAHYCIPHLKLAQPGHIINLSPPISLDPKWLGGHVPYTITKYGMTLAVIGLAEELRAYNIAVNALWPRTVIATAAINMLMGEAGMQAARVPRIMADAVLEILKSDASFTGQMLIDETFLQSRGVTDFDQYRVNPDIEPVLDLYVDK